MNKKPYHNIEYKYPVASRKQLLDTLIEAKKPLSFKEMVEKFKYKPNSFEGLQKRLQAMVREGQILQNRNQKYCILAKMDLIKGTVQGHHRDGFGFLIIDTGDKDLFIHFKQMSKVMHGDKVLAHKVLHNGKPEAKIIEVLEHANKTLVTRFVSEAGVGIGIPVNTRIKHEIIIPEAMQGKAKPNEMVLLEIIKQPSKRFHAVGKVVEVLGTHLDPGMEINVALHAWGIPHITSDEATNFAGQISTKVSKDNLDNRVDLTKTPLITIDGEDAKDLDDAVWCKPTPNGWQVIVAIADVSHYVDKEDVLDIEAKHRATSVYFPEFVVPMLPEVLSNGICSLNPKQNRLVMACEMNIDQKGIVSDFKFYSAVICSHARLTYNQVAEALVNPKLKLNQDLPVLQDLHQLYQILVKERQKRGALDFDTTETKIKFDEHKKIAEIVPVYRNDAHKIIEELMIAANVCAGKFISEHKIPALYRVHENPDFDKTNNLRQFLTEFGLELTGGDSPKPKDYTKTLAAAKTKPEFRLIQTVILRSLSQAVYQPQNLGHFGLAHEIYAHFTSPIRRYPDLLVHRAIKHILANQNQPYHYDTETMNNLGKQCSMSERRADDATRDVVDWLKCEYMQDKVGETFSGTVSSVTGFGLFVMLDEIYVDGLLHISCLEQDYYHFNSIRHRLEGSKRNYSIGNKLKVTVARVDLDERKIDFILADNKT